jgi:hypothetical protein
MSSKKCSENKIFLRACRERSGESAYPAFGVAMS